MFLRQYHEAVDGAHDLAGYRRLQALLHAWSIRAEMVSRPGFHDRVDAEAEAVRNGAAQTVPIEEAIAHLLGLSADDASAYWADKIDAARSAR